MSSKTTKQTTVTPDALKAGDLIRYNGQQAEVVSVKSWSDNLYGTVYGVDLFIKGKAARASFVKGSQVEVLL